MKFIYNIVEEKWSKYYGGGCGQKYFENLDDAVQFLRDHIAWKLLFLRRKGIRIIDFYAPRQVTFYGFSFDYRIHFKTMSPKGVPSSYSYSIRKLELFESATKAAINKI